MSQGKEYTVTLAEGYDGKFNVNTYQEITDQLEKLERDYRRCKELDFEEVEKSIAAGKLQGCWEGDVETERQNARNIESAAWAGFVGLRDYIRGEFGPKANLVDTLMTVDAETFKKASNQITDQYNAVNHHLAQDQWESEGAKAYKSAVEGQRNAVYELCQMSYDLTDSTCYAAMLNGSIFNSCYSSLLAIKVDHSEAQELGSDSLYMKRTDGMRGQCESLKNWLTTLVSTSGDWYGTAVDLDSEMSNQKASGANLKLNGVWPEAKAGTAKPASTGSMGSPTGGGTQGTHSGGEGQGGEIDD